MSLSRTAVVAAMLFVGTSLMGCLEGTITVEVNPDGSGTLLVEATISELLFPDEDIKAIAAGKLPTQVDLTQEFSNSPEKPILWEKPQVTASAGRVRVEARGYFTSIEALMDRKVTLKTRPDGGITLEALTSEKNAEKTKSAAPSTKFGQWFEKATMDTLRKSGVNCSIRIRMPGGISDAPGWTSFEGRTATWSMFVFTPEGTQISKDFPTKLSSCIVEEDSRAETAEWKKRREALLAKTQAEEAVQAPVKTVEQIRKEFEELLKKVTENPALAKELEKIQAELRRLAESVAPKK